MSCAGGGFQILHLKAFPSCSLLYFSHSVLFPTVMKIFEFSFFNPSLSAFCYHCCFILVLFCLLVCWLVLLYFNWWEKGSTPRLLKRCSFDKCFVQGWDGSVSKCENLFVVPELTKKVRCKSLGVSWVWPCARLAAAFGRRHRPLSAPGQPYLLTHW